MVLATLQWKLGNLIPCDVQDCRGTDGLNSCNTSRPNHDQTAHGGLTTYFWVRGKLRPALLTKAAGEPSCVVPTGTEV